MAEFEQRTAAFFSQNVDKLADQLKVGDGMLLAIPETTSRAKLVEVDDFARSRVGKRYKDWGIEDLIPGDLWNPPSRGILQSLIIARDSSGVGACVRLLSAEYWNPLTETFVDRLITAGHEFKQNREGDIAKFFGLAQYERSVLRFLDDSNTLYIVREGRIYNRKRLADSGISPEAANYQLGRLLE